MKDFAEAWGVAIERESDGQWSCLLTRWTEGTGVSELSFERYSSSSRLFQELISVLDASIFTSLAIAEGVLPEGQLPLL